MDEKKKVGRGWGAGGGWRVGERGGGGRVARVEFAVRGSGG